jgi:hypothetical protein
MPASASAEGKAMAVVGPEPYDMNSTREANGKVSIRTIDVGNRWSPLQNIDSVEIQCDIKIGDNNYSVTANTPMPRHPHSAYTTWFGVAYDEEMHGNTGIGTSKIPKVKPEIAAWAWGTISKNGEVISKMAPVHVMVMTKNPMEGITLEVSAEDQALLGAPGGYLNIRWPQITSLQTAQKEKMSREIIAWIILLLVVAWFCMIARRGLISNRVVL